MSAGDFFNRWSRRKSDAAAEPAAPATPAVEPAVPAEDLPPPTMEEVAALGPDADFRRFVQPGVDEAVRRSAMKKLFSDPHFNVMDGLDIYIDDYNKFEPLPAAMLAMLEHAKPVLDPLGHLQRPAMRMLDQAAPEAGAASRAAQQADETGQPPAQEAAGQENARQDDAPPEQPGAGESSPAATDTHTPGAVPGATPQDAAPPQDEHTI